MNLKKSLTFLFLLFFLIIVGEAGFLFFNKNKSIKSDQLIKKELKFRKNIEFVPHSLLYAKGILLKYMKTNNISSVLYQYRAIDSKLEKKTKIFSNGEKYPYEGYITYSIGDKYRHTVYYNKEDFQKMTVLKYRNGFFSKSNFTEINPGDTVFTNVVYIREKNGEDKVIQVLIFVFPAD